MTALQMAGTVLAIPLGLASGYSIYRANFSPEATCQSLRANIISMLDKSVDASTLRILVRRDVVSFEHSCGAVDPDAVAAFKALLTRGPIATAAPHVDARPKQAERASREAKETKQASTAPVVESHPQRDEAAGSDASWLAAVRHALIRRDNDRPSPHVEALATAPAMVSAAAPARQSAPDLRAPEGTPLAAPVPAPSLPPAATVAVAPATAPMSNHPIPPALIPDVTPVTQAGDTMHPQAGAGSRFARLIAHIPFVGYVVGDRPQ